jgi:transcriptional regulator with XRE-family HTH domain
VRASEPCPLGETIYHARMAQGLSLRAAAKSLGITASYLSDIENERRIPAEEVLERIGLRLNVSVDELMALAGRFGEEADRYLKQRPLAVRLLRTIAERRLSDAELRRLLSLAEVLGD